jgi:6-phosphogluconolactonase
VQRVSTEGDWPRNFGLDPSGRFLLVGNQRSNAITVFRVDTATGRLTFTGQRAEVQSPACIKFYGARG